MVVGIQRWTTRVGRVTSIGVIAALVACAVSTVGAAGTVTGTTSPSLRTASNVPMQPGSAVHHSKTIHGSSPGGGASQNSLDWAGYADTGTTFTSVLGSWIQPTATCGGAKAAQAAFWVGLDGYLATDPTVQQIGTDSDCTKGTKKHPGVPDYYLWYQLYPSAVVIVRSTSYAVAPGDTMTATVLLSGPTYTLTLVDFGKWTYTTTQTPAKLPQNSSAEWIAEAPAVCVKTCKPVPLANFGTIAFSSAAANGLPISLAAPTVVQLNMTTKNGKTLLARSSALTSGGTAFTVTWFNL